MTMLTSIVQKMRAPFLYLAPEETASRRVLPVTLLLRPLPLLALLVLVVNDQILKASDLLPGAITGKLSDLAGLFFAPLLVVTALNMSAWAIAQLWPVDVPLRSATLTQTALAAAAIGIGFTLVQVNPAVAVAYSDAMATLSFWNPTQAIPATPDPTDLVALVSLLGAFFYARQAIGRFPPGRLAQLEAAAAKTLALDLPDAETALLDRVRDVLTVVDDERVTALEGLCDHVLAGRSAETIDLDLMRLRGEAPPRASPIA